MQSPVASAAAISGNDLFADEDFEESFDSQAATSNRMPLLSGHLYYEQLHRMRRRRDTLGDVELACDNHFYVHGDDEEEGSSKPASLCDSHPKTTSTQCSVIDADFMHLVGSMRKNVLQEHPAVRDMQTKVQKQEETNARSQRLMEELIATVMASAPIEAPARPTQAPREDRFSTTSFTRLPAEGFKPNAICRKPEDTLSDLPEYDCQTDYAPQKITGQRIPSLLRRPLDPSGSYTSPAPLFTADPAPTTPEFSSNSYYSNMAPPMNFRSSSYAGSDRATDTFQSLMDASRLSPAAAAIRYRQCAARPAVDRGTLRDLLDHSREREAERITTRLMARQRGKGYCSNPFVLAVRRLIETLKAWQESARLRAEMLGTYFNS